MGEYVLVPREWVESTVKAGAGEVVVLSDIATLAECLNQTHQGKPVGEVTANEAGFWGRLYYTPVTDGTVNVGDKLYTHPASADPGEVERLRRSVTELRKSLREQNGVEFQNGKLRAQLAELRQCLAGLAYLGTGAAYERAIAALSTSAEPSAPVEIDERASFEANVPIPAYVYWDEKQSRYLTNCNHSACAVYQGSFEGWQARAALERKP